MGKVTQLRVEPRARRHRIDEVFVAVSECGAGEQIYFVHGPSGEKLPLVALNKAAVAKLRQFAQSAANLTGKNVSIIRFTSRSLHDTVAPVSTGD